MRESGEQWGDWAMHTHISILPQTHLPSRLLNNIEQSSLCSISRTLLAPVNHFQSGKYCLPWLSVLSCITYSPFCVGSWMPCTLLCRPGCLVFLLVLSSPSHSCLICKSCDSVCDYVLNSSPPLHLHHLRLNARPDYLSYGLFSHFLSYIVCL